MPEYPASLKRFKDGTVVEYHAPRPQGISNDPEEQLHFEWLTYAAMDNTEAAYEFTVLNHVVDDH